MKTEIEIPVNDITLYGNLTVPKNALGIVAFVHGSGSSRFSPRNNFVAQELNKAGLATLLFDLLTQEEEVVDQQTQHLRFDIPLLTQRLITVTHWIKKQPKMGKLKIGYFGSSTGAAAALIGAAELQNLIHAVVSRGGRTDLADDYAEKIKTPVLCIAGELDTEIIQMNEKTLEKINTEKKLIIIPNATHLFRESGALEQVTEAAKKWLKHYLG